MAVETVSRGSPSDQAFSGACRFSQKTVLNLTAQSLVAPCAQRSCAASFVREGCESGTYHRNTANAKLRHAGPEQFNNYSETGRN